MTTKEKLVHRIKCCPSDFRYAELVTLLALFGYKEDFGGKTSGSVVHFIDEEKDSITIHKPHPGTVVKKPYLRAIVEHLVKRGYIK
jgi:hypothetical protein